MAEIPHSHFPAEGIAVYAQRLGGLGLVAIVFVQHALDKSLFELGYRIRKKDARFNHLIDESLELVSQPHKNT